MTDDSEPTEQEADAIADRRVVITVFIMLILMTVHFVSGFTFNL